MTWVNLYVCANALLALCVVLLAAIAAISVRLRHPVAYRHRLWIGNTLVVAAVLLPFATLLSGHEEIMPSTAQVWSAPTMNGPAAGISENQRIAVSFAPIGASMSLEAVSKAAAGLFMAGFLVSLFRVGVDARTTIRIIAQAQTIRRQGRLSIRASDEINVPFSFWWPSRYHIVVPSTLVLCPGDLKIAIWHEAQHHRRQDTKWLYVYQLVRALFFWNPAVHRLERHLRALQEFACDEALTGRKKVVAPEYCACLLRLAEAAALTRRALIHARMIDSGGAHLLKRRFEAVLRRPLNHQAKPAVAATAIVSATLLAITALAFGSTIDDRRVRAEEAARMAAFARANGAFPIAVNDGVLRQLNLLLATPDGRAYLKDSLDRMRSYTALTSGEIAWHGLPAELLAVPLVESGYRNLPPDGHPGHGAGLWMFIEPTARRYGLAVNASRDERLDVTAETRAAMRYFADLYHDLGDWGLAVLAYNAGSARVEEGIRSTGSRDVWRIIGEGYENDPDYLPRVMAAMLIIGNPSVLD